MSTGGYEFGGPSHPSGEILARTVERVVVHDGPRLRVVTESPVQDLVVEGACIVEGRRGNSEAHIWPQEQKRRPARRDRHVSNRIGDVSGGSLVIQSGGDINTDGFSEPASGEIVILVPSGRRVEVGSAE